MEGVLGLGGSGFLGVVGEMVVGFLGVVGEMVVGFLGVVGEIWECLEISGCLEKFLKY